jgi:hypothetical protein
MTATTGSLSRSEGKVILKNSQDYQLIMPTEFSMAIANLLRPDCIVPTNPQVHHIGYKMTSPWYSPLEKEDEQEIFDLLLGVFRSFLRLHR